MGKAVTKPASSPRPGRPSLYSEDLALEILSRMAAGEMVAEICEDPGMPGTSTLHRWREANEWFRDAYMRAREEQAHAVAETGYLRARDAKDAALDRLAFDGARWLSSKIAPRDYGDKLDLNHSGELAVKAIPDDKLESRLAVLLGKAGIAGVVGGEGAAEVQASN